MSDFTLIQEQEQYRYRVNGEIFFKLQGRIVYVETYCVARNPNHPELYVNEIVTTDGEELIFEGMIRGVWPIYVKRLFDEHARNMRAQGRRV